VFDTHFQVHSFAFFNFPYINILLQPIVNYLRLFSISTSYKTLLRLYISVKLNARFTATPDLSLYLQNCNSKLIAVRLSFVCVKIKQAFLLHMENIYLIQVSNETFLVYIYVA